MHRRPPRLLQRKHALRVDVLVELNTRPVVQANTWLNLRMAAAAG